VARPVDPEKERAAQEKADQKAIEFEKKAIDVAIAKKMPQWIIEEFEETLEQMKKGQPTYAVQPLR
jgi:hypothetical protein